MKGISSKVTRGLPTGARLNCIDNTGAKELAIIAVLKYHGTHRRYPCAGIGDLVVASVKKGNPEMKKQVVTAVIVRQKRPFKRSDGLTVQFADNAAVVTGPKGELKGSVIKGIVAKEAADRWPSIAAASSMIA